MAIYSHTHYLFVVVVFPCFRDYCTDLKAQSDNITQFLIDFNEYIDTKTPNNQLCEYLLELSGSNPELDLRSGTHTASLKVQSSFPGLLRG